MQNLDKARDMHTFFKYDIKFSEVNRVHLRKKDVSTIKNQLIEINSKFMEIINFDEDLSIDTKRGTMFKQTMNGSVDRNSTLDEQDN